MNPNRLAAPPLPHAPHLEAWLRRFYPNAGLPQLTEHYIPHEALSPEAPALRVVHLTDLHLDFWNLPAVEAAIELTNRLEPDLIFLTGDYIAQGKRYLPALQSLLGTLSSRMGVFACMGNHDYSDGSAGLAVLEALRKAEVEPLVNENRLLRTPQGYALQVAGVDDFLAGSPCMSQTLAHLSPETPTCFLAHNPRHFRPLAMGRTPGVVFSGHTHGGQIHIPKLTNWLSQRLEIPYLAGRYEHRDSQLYVSRGVGSAIITPYRHTWGFPTFRWGAPPEVAMFHLYSARYQPQPKDFDDILSSLFKPSGKKSDYQL